MTRRKQSAPNEQPDWVTLKAAARALGEAPQTVLKRALRGEIVAEDRAGFVFVRRDTIDALQTAKTAAA